jgi:hypothetical protein
MRRFSLNRVVACALGLLLLAALAMKLYGLSTPPS